MLSLRFVKNIYTLSMFMPDMGLLRVLYMMKIIYIITKWARKRMRYPLICHITWNAEIQKHSKIKNILQMRVGLKRFLVWVWSQFGSTMCGVRYKRKVCCAYNPCWLTFKSCVRESRSPEAQIKYVGCKELCVYCYIGLGNKWLCWEKVFGGCLD